MNGFFDLLVSLFSLSILVSFGGIIYAFIKKKRKKPFVKALFASILLLSASSYAYHQTESPEQLAADRQRRLDSKAEREQRAAKQAKDDADQKQAFIDKQAKDKQDAEDAKLQKQYDDQAKYEAWLAQKAKREDAKLQKQYDDQAKYEAELAQKAEDDRIKVDGTYTVSMDMLVTREYHDVAMVQRAAENQDNAAIVSLTYEGKIFAVNEGTSVTVLDKGYGYAAVYINNGEYIGQTGYIPIATLE